MYLLHCDAEDTYVVTEPSSGEIFSGIPGKLTSHSASDGFKFVVVFCGQGDGLNKSLCYTKLVHVEHFPRGSQVNVVYV